MKLQAFDAILLTYVSQGGLEIPYNLVFEGDLKEVEKVKKLVTLVESDPPTSTEVVDANENISSVNLEITKSSSAAISVSEPSSTVVRIKESAGASVIVSKLTAPAEISDNCEKNNKLSCSIKVEDSLYALVDLTSSSTSSESEIKRNIVNQEELVRIKTGTK